MKVLVVDDSHLNLAVAKRYLEEIPDIANIYLCDDPRQVLTILDEYSIDILISDIMMPVINGFELLEKLRADEKYDDMPIIMLTYLDDLESYKKCFELGAFDYINKPINEIEFTARLKVAIQAKYSSNNLKSLLEVTRKQNEDLKVMNAELTEAKFSLVQSEKMAAIGQLAAGIAHEINNPMAFVSSNFEILKNYFHRFSSYIDFLNDQLQATEQHTDTDCDSIRKRILNQRQTMKVDQLLEESAEIFRDLESGINRVTDIVQSLRVFARSSKDSEKAHTSLLDLVKQTVLITQNEVKYVANIMIDVPSDLIIYCNPVQLGQVFVNMVVNASQAIRDQKRNDLGTITITASKVDQEVFIRIKDDGPGIPSEHLLRIFEPFFTTKEIGKGTGLGLSISYDIIVNKHHGTIDVESEVNKGTTFFIKLPIITP
ncbi:response regulator [Lachnospiraceae bacterium MD1]|uniref:Stage 0 sporulation protein A homolog n=1 Tax=Variimorphobacter saccharofermentans TaxID=2755051 RepID=A0A839K3S7_9FIRM|nr:ATP-binding protein [Variimorphobacter saccharofermentans]MBB2183331.1 response regulator [Variimorphobacter saccharofermentans]